MKTFRYDTSHNWYKGNTHIHSTASDGALDFQQLGQIYAGEGYRFLFRTDHWVSSDVSADANPYPLLWLDGVELHGNDESGAFYHIVCLGTFKGITRSLTLTQAVETARSQGGLIILAHPHWTGNTLEDALRHPFDGVEAYNHVCQWMNGKGAGTVHWNAMLAKNTQVFSVACDDAHITQEDPGWNGGWIFVNAPELSSQAVLGAIRAGNFYASTGPDFYSIEYNQDRVYVKCSPVKFIRLVGPNFYGRKVFSANGDAITEAEFQAPENWAYAYLQLEDHSGRMAWTNSLFTDC